MSDLISRQDAIEAIASRDETDGTVKVFTGREVNEILSALPSADRPTVDKEYLIDLIQEAVYDGEACAKLIDLVDRPTWISMREKKPKKGQRVIYLYDALADGMKMTAESSNATRVINDVAIAWMPFPPYKEDSDG